MTAFDAFFHALAAAALVAAAAAALTGDERRAVSCAVVTGAALSALFALADAHGVAAMQAGVVAIATMLLRKGAKPRVAAAPRQPTEAPGTIPAWLRREQEAGDTTDWGDDETVDWSSSAGARADAGRAASTRAAAEHEEQDAAAPLHEDANVASAALPQEPANSDAAPPRAARGRWAAAVLVGAFLALTMHAVLITRWPLRETARSWSRVGAVTVPAVGLSHFFVVALALFSLGLVTIVLRRHRACAWIGVETMIGGAVLAIVAVAAFVGGTADGQLLAMLVVASGGLVASFGERLGHPAIGAAASDRLANSVVGALAGLAIALATGTFAW